MPTTRKKVIKTVYKEEDNTDDGDFSDSGSEAQISEASGSSDDDIEDEAESSGNEFNQSIINQKQSKIKKSKPTVKKTNFVKSFMNKLKSVVDDEERSENKTTFTVKDLTEADKLLPAVLNLSESDSSDDENPVASTSRNNISSTSYNSQQNESDTDEIKEPTHYNDVWSKNLQNSEEIAKQAFLELEKHKLKIDEAKASIEQYTSAKSNSAELDVSDLLAQGEEVPDVKPKKPSKAKKKRIDSDSEIEDWEEVNEPKIPQQGIQLVVDFPDGGRKAKKLDVEMMMRRKINRVKKEYQVFMHKVHVLCWLGHGNYVSKVLNDQDVMAAALKLVPSQGCFPGERIDMKYVEQITTWFKGKITLKQDKNEDKFKPKAPPLKEMLLSHITSKSTTTKKYLVYIFVSLLRALGLQCRIMLNFVTLPIKPPTSELCSLSTKNKDKSDNDISPSKMSGKGEKAIKKESSSKCKKNKSSRSKIPQIDGNDDYYMEVSDEEFGNIMQVDGNDDKQTKTRSTRGKIKPKVSDKDDDDDVSPPKKSKMSSTSAKDEKQINCDDTSIKVKRSTRKSSPTNMNQNLEVKKSKAVANKSNDIKTEKPSPRKTRAGSNNSNKAKLTEKEVTTTKLSKTVKLKKESNPDIIVTNEDGKQVASKYFNNKEQKELTSKRPSLSRKRSQTATPVTVKDEDKTKTNSRSRAKSASDNAIKSEYFSSSDRSKNVPNKSTRQRKAKVDLEDAQRVSHRDLNKKPNKTDVTEDLKNIIKSRVRDAKAETRKKIVKDKIKEESDNDSDYLPEEEPSKRPSVDSNDDFKPTKINLKPKSDRKIDRRVLSSDDDTPKNKVNVWCEIFVEELEQWVPVDVIKAKVHCANEIYNQATHPVAYIVGWDNCNYLKDLTRRYVPHWNTVTRKQRAEQTWLLSALRPWLGPKTARDREEDEYLDRMQMEAPLPKSITEYKNHPLYALKRHLLKFEAIYPPDAATLGFVRGEAVYARDCVYTCRSRDTWLKEAKVVKLGEKPYKIVKARPKWDKLSNKVISDLPLEVFGPWQIKDYEPPTAENGKVPRNAYGNVELFKECMLPKGTVHMKLPGLNKVARKWNIDCAPAMTGFDFNGGYTHPVFDGFVVCKEFEEILMDAWVKDQEEQERKEVEKLETRVYGNWKRLIKGLFIRERLKDKYGFDNLAHKEDKKKTKGPKLVVKKKC